MSALVSSNRVLSDFYNMFKNQLVGNGWKFDAMEAIGAGLGIIGVKGRLVVATKESKRKDNYNHPLPTTKDKILAITYKGLSLYTSTRKIPASVKSALYGECVQEHGEFNGPYYKVSFLDEPITFHYLCPVMDEDGFPMIPDNELLIQALKWYLIREGILSDWIKPPKIDFALADQKWEIYYPRAQNDMSFPTDEEMVSLESIWSNPFGMWGLSSEFSETM